MIEFLAMADNHACGESLQLASTMGAGATLRFEDDAWTREEIVTSLRATVEDLGQAPPFWPCRCAVCGRQWNAEWTAGQEIWFRALD